MFYAATVVVVVKEVFKVYALERFVEQKVDIQVPGGGLHDLPVSGDVRGEGFFFPTVPHVKK